MSAGAPGMQKSVLAHTEINSCSLVVLSSCVSTSSKLATRRCWDSCKQRLAHPLPRCSAVRAASYQEPLATCNRIEPSSDLTFLFAALSLSM
jgi:hypothetical protein